ncbi:MAG: hypothetical protein KGO81_06100 [Bacteroidota bacterium]|nr:hypothetical protein [Bacteroidota bacterium]
MKYFLLSFLFIPFMLTAQNEVLSNQQVHIFTLGDSNGTFPYSWPQQLQIALPNAQVFNISKSGRTIGFLNLGDSSLNSLLVLDENLRKAAKAAKDKPYDYIIIALGTNDAKAVFADRQEEVPINLDHLIKRIKNCIYSSISKAKIIIISPPPYGKKAEATEKYAGGGKRVLRMSNTFEAIAKQNGCFFVNGYATPGLDIDTMTEDGLHLDAIGSHKLIEPVVALMLH